MLHLEHPLNSPSQSCSLIIKNSKSENLADIITSENAIYPYLLCK